MKKVIFYISIVLAIYHLFSLIRILTNDLERLTTYGYGFLTGKIILLVIFILIAYLTRNKKEKIKH